ncbi:hypothetical protein BSL78_23332 [Apostichopus japonicus]|uniref:Uncharacterized protein n=1 Tax=Stichopus japonicus TaxID=307972 RepID=A0A2G8JVP6_STIJA|nr:hypothetical protein BSL78_23332 [Apostichopus japonicus]
MGGYVPPPFTQHWKKSSVASLFGKDLHISGFISSNLISLNVAEWRIPPRSRELVPLSSPTSKLSLPFFRGQFQLLSVEGYSQIFKLMNPAVRAMFGEVEALLWLLLVSSASSTEAERSFSALRRLKTWLRSTMTQQRLNHVMVCYIHRERLAQLKPEELSSLVPRITDAASSGDSS